MDRKRAGRLFVGTSGYQYNHWKGVFYPEGVKKKDWLDHYVQHFATVEINNTFYNLPKVESFDAWRAHAPEGFCYALKFSRYGSHIKRLKDPEQPISMFLKRAERLGPVLGPILVQLPPNWGVNADRLRSFLEAAPRSHRWAVEVRDPSWLCDPIYDLLQQHDAALVVHDSIEDHPREITADWVYMRFHGTGSDYGGGYSAHFLSTEARRIHDDLEAGRDVYVYFNNDAHGHAVHDAQALLRYVERKRASRRPQSSPAPR